ncbi:hypothetical protein [Flavobacterium suzhouense]|uniref:DoxX-like family protein n=1 Tax=Flavobacterium suzhouense TaxID=1529638 RepID=A0ABW5NZ23_9FLAO
MVSKTKRIVSIVLTSLIGVMLVIGGVMKILRAEPESILDQLAKYGYIDYLPYIGVGSLLAGGLLLYPKTSNVGFLLGSCYFAGATALEISGKQPLVAPVLIMILWIGMFLRNKEMFVNSGK